MVVKFNFTISKLWKQPLKMLQENVKFQTPGGQKLHAHPSDAHSYEKAK